MAPITRAQIEAAVTQPIYKIEVWVPTILGGVEMWDVVAPEYVLSISGSQESTGNTTNGLAFGMQVAPKATITFTEDASSAFGGSLRFRPILDTRVRISFTYDNADWIIAFEGVLTSISFNEYTITYQCAGFDELIKQTKIRTVVDYNRPIATKTTVASQENPDLPGYTGGTINEILFRSGGRPYEQRDFNYTYDSPGMKFWYTCDQSLFAPEWTWLNDENLLDEVFTLVRAAGGQLYQTTNIIKYVEPLSFATGTSIYKFTTDTFQSAEWNGNPSDKVGTLTCTYTPRRVEPLQEVANDETPRYFEPSEQKTFTIETNLPVYTYALNETDKFVAKYVDMRDASPTINNIEVHAQKIIITLTNPSNTTPMVLYSTKIKGRPIAAGQSNTIQVGNGLPERIMEDNPYIQNEQHALRLATMTHDFYGDIKPIITLSGATFDPQRYVGELVTFRYDEFTYLDVAMRIVAIRHTAGGSLMDVDVVEVTGLPTRNNMFIIGNTYSDGEWHQVSY